MTVSQYLNGILLREAVDISATSPILYVQTVLHPMLLEWAGVHLLGVSPSGSFAKGTANRTGTDIDLFISLAETTPETLKQIYDKLLIKASQAGYTPKKRNVSISINVLGYDVDLVPGKRQNAYSTDHSLYRNRAGSWTKTNVFTHINTVLFSGRQPKSAS